MYKLEPEKLGKYDIYCLSDENSDFYVKFVLDKGATISDLRLKGQNIYDGYSTFEDLEALDWSKGILLAPFPNRMKNGKYSFEGKEYQFPINDVGTETALHGFISQLKFSLGKVELNAKSASISCHTFYTGNLKYYPFPFTADVKYILDSAHGFQVRFSVTNAGKSKMPIGLGWHPYFQLSEKVDDTILKLPSLDKIEIDTNMIPTGKTSSFTCFEKDTKIGETTLDNCFILKDNTEQTIVELRGEKGKLTYKQNSNIPFLQVFTPPHRQSIALEPMTCNIDAFNNKDGLQILEPNESIELECSIKLTMERE